jgi:hypothetical protein
MPIHPLCRQPVGLVGRVQPNVCFDWFALIGCFDQFALIDLFYSLLMLLPRYS